MLQNKSKMMQDIFNVVRSTSTPRGHAQRINTLDRIKKYKHNLYKERLSLYSCWNCVCGDIANSSASSPRLS